MRQKGKSPWDFHTKVKMAKRGGNFQEQKVLTNLAELIVFLTKLSARGNTLWKKDVSKQCQPPSHARPLHQTPTLFWQRWFCSKFLTPWRAVS